MEQLLRKEVDEATTVLRQSRDLLETWKAEYFSMRSRLEESECDRRSVLHKRTKLNYWIDNVRAWKLTCCICDPEIQILIRRVGSSAWFSCF